MISPSAVIATPDQRLRVFISSTLAELAVERATVRDAVETLRLSPVMFELGARPHPPRDLYRAYLAQSDVFIGVYWQRYGWIAPDMETSGLEDEYDQCGAQPRLLYIKEPAPDREPRLAALLERIEAEVPDSCRTFSDAEELAALVGDDLAGLLSQRFTAGNPWPAGQRPPSRGTLPAPVTSLIGREAAIEEITALLVQPAVRLVTLTGPGGIGKTRLALAVAAVLRDQGVGDVAFAPMAAIRDPELVLPAIATAVGANMDHRRSAHDALAARFEGAPALLVVDNLEQVVAGVIGLPDLLARCPDLTILATSRTVVRLAGEHEYPVEPLGLSGLSPGDWFDQLTTAPAVALFADRAAAVQPGFTVDPSNALAVAEICRRLDGLPLAIELAAARTRLLPPSAMLTRLGTRLDVLGAGPSDLPERQRTLRATIEWSLALLDAEATRSVVMLACFVDGCTLEAAAWVWQVDDLAALRTLDDLVGHSLLVATAAEDQTRFRMLETVRELLSERLEADPLADAVHDRHAEHFRELLAQADMPLRTDGHDEWGPRLEREHANLRAATRWTLDHEDLSVTAVFLRRQFIHWWLNDHLVEARGWLQEALGRAQGADHQTRANLHVTMAMTAMELGADQEAVTSTAEAAQHLQRLDDPYLRAHALLLHAWMLPTGGKPLSEAMRYLDEAIEIMEGNAQGFMLGIALSARGTNRFLLSQHEAAVTDQRRAVEVGIAMRNRRVVAQATNQLGLALLASGHIEDGTDCLADSATRFLQLDDTEGVALCLSTYAMVACQQGDLERAATAIGAADEQRRRAGISVWPTLRPILEDTTREVRTGLGAGRFEAARATGAGMTRQEAIAVAGGERLGGSPALPRREAY
jgi:predicted ATPase